MQLILPTRLPTSKAFGGEGPQKFICCQHNAKTASLSIVFQLLRQRTRSVSNQYTADAAKSLSAGSHNLRVGRRWRPGSPPISGQGRSRRRNPMRCFETRSVHIRRSMMRVWSEISMLMCGMKWESLPASIRSSGSLRERRFITMHPLLKLRESSWLRSTMFPICPLHLRPYLMRGCWSISIMLRLLFAVADVRPCILARVAPPNRHWMWRLCCCNEHGEE